MLKQVVEAAGRADEDARRGEAQLLRVHLDARAADDNERRECWLVVRDELFALAQPKVESGMLAAAAALLKGPHSISRQAHLGAYLRGELTGGRDGECENGASRGRRW